MSKKSVFSLQFIIKFFRNFLNAKNRRSLDPINVQEICGKSNKYPPYGVIFSGTKS